MSVLAYVLASDDRLHGYRKALERAGIPFDPSLVVDGRSDPRVGAQAEAGRTGVAGDTPAREGAGRVPRSASELRPAIADR